MSVKVSIILPSYNVHTYIRECMDSVIGQTFRDLEILCIDAGSTDGTLEILREYEQADQRVNVILSDRKSYGYQINLGISLATGEYIGIVETDDYIEPDMFEYLYGLLMDRRVDFAKAGTVFCYDVVPELTIHEGLREFPFERYSEKTGTVFVDSDQEPEILWHDFHLWNGLYRSDILKDIKLSETAGAAYQDTGFLVQLYTKGVKGLFSDHPAYHYRQMNYGASAYNPRAISFLRYEYDRIDDVSKEWDDKWKRAVMIKLYYQLITKLKMMGLQGKYWEDAKEDMIHLQNMIKHAIQQGCLSLADFPEGQQENAKLFLQDPTLLYQKYHDFWLDQKNKRDNLLAYAENRPIIVFGAGKVGKYVLALLMKKNLIPVMICDNEENKWGEKTAGIETASMESASELFPNAYYIIAVGAKNRETIRNQLMEAKIAEDHIMTYTFEWTDRDLLLL